jgi:hypothetical protein
MIDEIDIVVLFLVIVVSVMLGCQHMRKKHKNHKNKMKYTCGVEGECEKSIHGTYDTKSQCESECGMISH